MDTVKNLITARMKNVQIALSNMTKYINMIKHTIIGYDAPYYELLASNLSIALTLCEEISHTDYTVRAPLDMIITFVTLYTQLDKLESSARIVVDLYRDEAYIKRAVYNMSVSYITQIKRDAVATQEYMAKFITDAISDDKEIFDIIFQHTLPMTVTDPNNELLLQANKYNRDLIYDYVITTARGITNKFTTALIGRLIEMLNKETSENASKDTKNKDIDKDIKSKDIDKDTKSKDIKNDTNNSNDSNYVRIHILEQIIENQLSSVLGADRIRLNYSSCQGILVRYNLAPVSRSMPPSELLKDLLQYNEIDSLEENLKTSSHNICVLSNVNISLNNVAASAIEFDLRSLIDYNYIQLNDLNLSPTAGLTKKTIKKYNTVRMLPNISDEKSNKEDNKNNNIINTPIITYLNNPDSTKWYVIETINGSLYRFLGINGEKHLDEAQIIGLLQGVSTRCEKYNQIIADEIAPLFFDEKNTILLRDYAANYVTTSAETIKSAIVDKLVMKFKATYTDVKLPIGHRKMHKIISLDEFTAYINDSYYVQIVLLDVLVHLKGTRGSGSIEYLITYLVKFDDTLHKFMAEISHSYEIEAVNKNIFVDYSGDELQRVLTDIYKGVVIRAVNELDRESRWDDYDTSLKEYMLDKKQIIV